MRNSNYTRGLLARAIGRSLADDAREEVEKSASILRIVAAHLAHGFFDAAQHAGRVALERRSSALAGFREQRPEARHEAFRPAAHRADLVAERGTAAARSPLAAERAQHSWALLYNPARNRQSSSERALQPPEVVVEPGNVV